jgi:hypothetical protein
MYRPSNPGEAKEPSNGSNHGLSVWRFVGKWINFMNQMKGSRIITAGEAHWGSKHIPEKNCVQAPPGKQAGGLHNMGNPGNTTKLNKQSSGVVSAEEHEEMVCDIQTLQI